MSLLKRLRTPIASVLIIIMLASVGLVFCFGAAYKLYASDNNNQMSDKYTTIAIPDDVLLVKKCLNFFTTDPDTAENYRMDLYLSLYHFTNSTNTATLDTRRYLRGVLADTAPVLSTYANPAYGSKNVVDAPRNSAYFIATCVNIEWLPTTETGYDEETGDMLEFYYNREDSVYDGYKLTFQVDDTLLLHKGHGDVQIVYATHGAFTLDGEIPFEVGKQYFLFGRYVTPFYISADPNNIHSELVPNPEGFDQIVLNIGYTLDGIDYSYWLDGIDFVFEEKQMEIDGQMRRIKCFCDDAIAWFCLPYEYEANLDSFWAQHPKMLTEFDFARRSVSSAYVMTTGRLDSILYFNKNLARVAAGREFTKEELSGGASVCLVGEHFASFNGLTIGDSIKLDVYTSRFEKAPNYSLPLGDDLGVTATDAFVSEIEVEIIGIYTAPEFNSQKEAYGLNPNTIIIPDAAIPYGETIVPLPASMDSVSREEAFIVSNSQYMWPQVFSAVIDNDKLEAFKAAAREAGMLDYFLFYDQGYANVADPMRQIIASANTILLLAAGILLLGVAVLAVLTLRDRHELGLCLSLGMKPRHALASYAAGWLALLLPAMILCAVITASAFEPLSQYAMKQVVAQEGVSRDLGSGGVSSPLLNEMVNRGYTKDIALLAVLQMVVCMSVIIFLGAIYLNRGTLALLRKKE